MKPHDVLDPDTGVTAWELMLQPCRTREELRNWLKVFLNIDPPDTIVDPDSNCTPLDMAWKIYSNCIWYAFLSEEERETKMVFYASRMAFKTYLAAAVEFMVAIHDQRGVVHTAATLQQARKAFNDYFKRFLSKPIFRPFVEGDESLEVVKALKNDSTQFMFGNRTNIQVIPVTKQAAQGQHESLLCFDGDTLIATKVGTAVKLFKISELYSKFQSGKTLKILSWNEKTGIVEPKKAIGVYKTGRKKCLSLKTKDEEIVLTPEHRVWVDGKGFIPASEVQAGDCLFQRGGRSGVNARPRRKGNSDYSFLKKLPRVEAGDEFEQILLGSCLGDGGVYCKKDGNAYFQERHSLKQEEYLEWKASVLRTKIDNAYCRKLKSHVSGYTGKQQITLRTGQTSILNGWETFKKGDLDKEKVSRLGLIGLAVWYMDDGSSQKRFTISSHSFSKEDNEFLAELLREKFGLEDVKVVTRRKEGGRVHSFLEGSRRDLIRLRKLCGRYFHSSMVYKFRYISFGKVCVSCGSKFSFYNGTPSNIKYCNRVPCRSLAAGVFKKVEVVSKADAGVRSVYDITVADNHTVLASKSLILLHNCRDEIDVVEDVQAYKDLDGIPIDMPDKRPPIDFGISVRKSAFGLVQKQIEKAKDEGVGVYHWNIMDITERCPDSRSGTEKVNLYVLNNTLSYIPEEEYEQLDVSDQRRYLRYEGFKGCYDNCQLFAACLTNLKNQTSRCKWLKKIEFVEERLKKIPEDVFISQLLCRKPPTEGLVYSRVDDKNKKTYKEMWEIFSGEPWPNEKMSLDEFIKEMNKHNVPCFAGMDWGYFNPSVCVVGYVDRNDNVYIVYTLSKTGMDNADFIQKVYDEIHSRFNVQMYFPDSENPSGISMMAKIGLPVSKKVPKGKGSVYNGIQVVKSFIRIPGRKSDAKLFISQDNNELLWYEFTKYHWETDAQGNIDDTKAASENNHSMDALRYFMYTIFGKNKPNLAIVSGDAVGHAIDSKNMDRKGKFVNAPTPSEFANHMGVNNFRDNREDFDDSEKEDEASGSAGGFSWSF